MNKSSTEQQVYRYPWARALMIVVLYGALLVFLWHFPTTGGRAFFQTLFKGFFYILAGLALIVITIIFFLFFPIPPAPEKMEDALDNGYVDMYDDEYDYSGALFPVRTLIAPTFKNPSVEPRIWEILYSIEREELFACDIFADIETGVIAVSQEDEEEALAALDEIRSRFKAAGIAVRNPR